MNPLNLNSWQLFSVSLFKIFRADIYLLTYLLTYYIIYIPAAGAAPFTVGRIYSHSLVSQIRAEVWACHSSIENIDENTTGFI
jgi:hypothetical protein